MESAINLIKEMKSAKFFPNYNENRMKEIIGDVRLKH